MSDGIEDFFNDLGARQHEPLLAKVAGRARFEIVDGKRVDKWLVAVDNGDVTVSHKGGSADCTISGDKVMFDRLGRGEANAMTAVLRGELQCRGDVELLFAIQRVFPGPRHERQDSDARGTS